MEQTIAIVGNPNVGKTTLFNALTGLSHITANYPGVTVDRVLGSLRLDEAEVHIIDLPGTYSLAAHSPDEMIVVDVLLDQQRGERHVDAILAVVDATNLERNLYLVSQLRELGKPMVVALNMCDLANRRHITVDAAKLGDALGVPVVPVCAHRCAGVAQLKQAIANVLHGPTAEYKGGPLFPEELEREVDDLCGALNAREDRMGRPVQRPEAFRGLVDRGGYTERRFARLLGAEFEDEIEDRRKRVVDSGSLSAIETRSRYAWIREVLRAGVKAPAKRVTTFSDRLDDVLTNRVLGTAVFLFVMAAVFQAIFAWAVPFMDIIDHAFEALSEFVGPRLPGGVLRSLVVDGVIAGVGSVVIFLPQILILTLFLALLEDCGYMARSAYLMDKLLSRCGLSGQSFIPLMSSFACAIPGILATRVISNRRDRFTTMMVAPLMSCSARLPIYAIFIAAFVPERPVLGHLLGLQGLTLLVMYLLGIVVAIPVAWLLKRTLLKGATPAFLLELPTYKVPQFRTVGRKVYDQGKEFLLRAGTLIFAVTVVMWALAYFPRPAHVAEEYQMERTRVMASMAEGVERDAALAAVDSAENAHYVGHSYIGAMGRAVEPLVKPLGWDWRIGMAAIASFPAREVVVSTLGAIFSLDDSVSDEAEGLRKAMKTAKWPDGRALFTTPVALSIMVFFALCAQCGATLVTIKRETRTWRWPVFTFCYMTVLAYTGALVVYQVTTYLGIGRV